MVARNLAWAIGAGVALGALLTVSPLAPIGAALVGLTLTGLRRNLSADERRVATAIVVAGMLARVAVVAALAVWSFPIASAQSGGVLIGDEEYLFERSLRARDVLFGYPVSHLDYQMAFEEYANTKYIWWLTWMQATFGPSPYALRIVNGLLFVAAAVVLYRLARRGFGPVPAQLGLALVLFWPSLLFGSVSLLKDSIFFLFTAGAFAAAVQIGRGSSRAAQAGGVLLLLVMLWALSDLRPLAIVLTGGGLAFGFVIRWIIDHRAGRAAALAATLVVLIAVVAVKPVSTAVLEGLTLLSRQHMGHVTTPGHAYRTLDRRFYPDWYAALGGLPLQPGEAARYIGRSALAFVFVPLPWDATTGLELLYIPEQLAWYAVAAFAIVGLPAAYRRDPLLACVLVGYILAMAAALALTNGNVGTLVRLRGLVTRFAIWIAAVGIVAAIERTVARGSK